MSCSILSILRDTLAGVKEASGKVIIPAKYPAYLSQYEDTIPISDRLIVLMNIGSGDNKASVSYGDAYDRYRKLLYRPLFFDNGADYFPEGFTRCVTDGKAGFMDAAGQIRINPNGTWQVLFITGMLMCATVVTGRG